MEKKDILAMFVALSPILFALWCVCAYVEGFMLATFHVLFAIAVTALIVAWLWFVAYLFDRMK